MVDKEELKEMSTEELIEYIIYLQNIQRDHEELKHHVRELKNLTDYMTGR